MDGSCICSLWDDRWDDKQREIKLLRKNSQFLIWHFNIILLYEQESQSLTVPFAYFAHLLPKNNRVYLNILTFVFEHVCQHTVRFFVNQSAPRKQKQPNFTFPSPVNVQELISGKNCGGKYKIQTKLQESKSSCFPGSYFLRSFALLKWSFWSVLRAFLPGGGEVSASHIESQPVCVGPCQLLLSSPISLRICREETKLFTGKTVNIL